MSSVLFLIIMNVAYSEYMAVFSKFLFSFYRYNFRLEKILTGIEFFVTTPTSSLSLSFFQDPAFEPSLLMLAWAIMSLLLSLIVVNVSERMK